MGPYLDTSLLTWVTFLPLASGLLLLGTGAIAHLFFDSDGLPPPVWRAFAMGSTTLTFLIAVTGLWAGFDPAVQGFQLTEHVGWLPQYGIHYFVGVDGISLCLVLLTTFLMPVVLLASWNDIQHSLRSYVFFMLFLETGMVGAFVSLNLFQFYVFWEVMLIPMYFIIGIWGGPRRIYAATKFFVFTMFGSLLMLVALLVVYWLNYEQGGAPNFDWVVAPALEGAAEEANSALSPLPWMATEIKLLGEAPWWQTQTWLFAAFALAFAIKVPVVPLHTWLPDAHVEAPTGGSVVLAGILLKMGTYGFVRFALPLFPMAASSDLTVDLAFALALVGIVYGSLVAMVQRDIKKLVAYSSVAHLGFVMLGIFALNAQGLAGAVLQMVNHGLTTGALFVLVGFLYQRRHTREIADLGGLARVMPVQAALFGVVVMASIGLPALNGFVGEFLILLGVFKAQAWVGVAATSGVVLAAVYMLWAYRRIFFGSLEHAENRALPDLDWRETAVVLCLIAPMLWIGVYPNPLLRRIEPAVAQVMETMTERGAALANDEAIIALHPAAAERAPHGEEVGVPAGAPDVAAPPEPLP